jgi:hypothetical protein
MLANSYRTRCKISRLSLIYRLTRGAFEQVADIVLSSLEAEVAAGITNGRFGVGSCLSFFVWDFWKP